jgi:hypothetical protein
MLHYILYALIASGLGHIIYSHYKNRVTVKFSPHLDQEFIRKYTDKELVIPVDMSDPEELTNEATEDLDDPKELELPDVPDKPTEPVLSDPLIGSNDDPKECSNAPVINEIVFNGDVNDVMLDLLSNICNEYIYQDKSTYGTDAHKDGVQVSIYKAEAFLKQARLDKRLNTGLL